MSDLEGGAFGLVYEYRDPCNAIALVQLAATAISLIFTYPVWWVGFFGLIVAAMGYYGSVEPVIQSKVSFVQFYYFGNCFMLLLQGFSAMILLILVSEWEDFDLWSWVVLVIGSLCLGLQICVTYIAVQRSQSYRAELMRNPPPAENIYGSNGASGGMYTSVAAVYKGPADVKTI
ncbi:hypothetical protein PINS_up012185 [Pythium insidiosum]|nr:hypothetical protein PINS_up012185 [Pythium insidiosum]